jgi:hypothetical protein
MTELVDAIKQQVARELLIYLDGMKNLSRESEEGKSQKFYVGDNIEFDVMINNKNPFPLSTLIVTIHQVRAVEFEDNPIVRQIEKLPGGADQKIATVRGLIRENPDDAKSAWRILDYVCKVTIKGEVDLPPIEFYDEEFEVAHIEDA